MFGKTFVTDVGPKGVLSGGVDEIALPRRLRVNSFLEAMMRSEKDSDENWVYYIDYCRLRDAITKKYECKLIEISNVPK
jgi:hypothetical protein